MFRLHKSISDHTWIQRSIHHSLKPPAATYLSSQHKNGYNSAVLHDIDVVSRLSLAQKLAPLSCAGRGAPLICVFLGSAADVKCFGGSLAAPVFVLGGGTFSGSLALLSLSSPLPSLTVGGLISEQDKLFSPLSRLQALSCWFSHLASGQRKQSRGPDCFRSTATLASTQRTRSIKASSKKKNPFPPKR